MSINLFIGNLPYTTDDGKLGEIFAPAGVVVSAHVITDKYSGRSRGFGFVEMSSDEEAKKAIELLNGTVVEGRPLVVNVAKPPAPGVSNVMV
ncbi:MAG: RNA-binding protein [Candidatus Gottesmanbacteria bacterium]